MNQLHLFLILNSGPEVSPDYAAMISSLKRDYRLHITVIFNGIPSFKLPIKHAYKSHSHALTFSGETLFKESLKAPNFKAEHILWFENQTQWDHSEIKSYLPCLGEWHAIHPRFSDSPLQEKEIDTQSFEIKPSQIPPHLPPCLLFQAKQWETLCLWLDPQGQIPIIYLGEAIHNPMFPPSHYSPNTKTDVLSISEAEARLSEAQELSQADPRQFALYQSLVRAFPLSVSLYPLVAQKLSPPEASSFLIQALKTKLITPQITGLLSISLMMHGSEKQAILMKDWFDSRFPGESLPPHIWGLVSAPKKTPKLPVPLPKPKKLGLILHAPSSIEWVQTTLDSLSSLISDCLILTLDPLENIKSSPQCRIQVCNELTSPLSSLSAHIEKSDSEWFICLWAGESISQPSKHLIQELLWTPPYQISQIQVAVERPVGDLCYTFSEPRIFKRGRLIQDPIIGTGILLTQTHPKANHTLSNLTVTHHSGDPSTSKFRIQHQKWRKYLRLWPESVHQEFWIALSFFWQGQNKQALQHLEKIADPPSDLKTQIYLRQLHAQILLKNWDRALELSQSMPQLGQRNPDYWYYKGLLAFQNKDLTQAIYAFETCTNLQTQIVPPYIKTYIESLARYQLCQIYWYDIFDSGTPIQTRQSHLLRLREFLHQMLQSHPSGEHPLFEINLYDFLGQICIANIHYYPGDSRVTLFRQSLPPHTNCTRAYYVETALLFLEGITLGIENRLPPIFSNEELKDLKRSPDALYSFAEKLWEYPEFDGQEIVQSFLHCTSTYHQDPKLELLLVQLLCESNQSSKALLTLKAATHVFTKNPHLYYKKALILIHTKEAEKIKEGIESLKKSIALAPNMTIFQDKLTQVLKEYALGPSELASP